MQTELRGSVPKLPFNLAGTLINRGWKTVRNRGLWSFQLFEGQWISPNLFGGSASGVGGQSGTVSVTQGNSIATLDATATTALNTRLAAEPWSLITQRQFRVGNSGTSVYNIWAYDGSGHLQLSRPYGEFSISSAQFSIYQAFYVPQKDAATLSSTGVLTVQPEYLKDFKSWISVRNIQNFIDLYTERYNRAQIDAIDPQRSLYFFPTDVIPYEEDQNPASATFGYFMFELWGNPTASYTYQLLGIRNGLDLVNSQDTLPIGIGEDLVVEYAKYWSYEWAEANRGTSTGGRLYYTGPDYKFLMGASLKRADKLLSEYRMRDREKVDNWFHIRRSAFSAKIPYPYYSSVSGMANAGTIP
jgi:hypothetical protein